MLSKARSLVLGFVRFGSVHADLNPNPMPYTASIFKSRLPHRMTSAYEVRYDELPSNLDQWPTLRNRLARQEKSSEFETLNERPTLRLSNRKFSQNTSLYRKNRLNSRLVKSQRGCQVECDASAINDEWSNSAAGIISFHSIAHHYGIYRDVLGSYDFYPSSTMRLALSNGRQVSGGDVVSPSEVSDRPSVIFDFNQNGLYSCAYLCLDGNPSADAGDCSLLWLTVNSKAELVSGRDVIDHVQPYPLRGVGYHRVACVLFEQNADVDVAQIKPGSHLANRTFDPIHFFNTYRNKLTPVGLAFFQCKWDPSVTATFHNYFDSKEPVLEYDFDEIELPKQVDIAPGMPFNEYLDRYRDRKEMNAEVLETYLAGQCPFRGTLEPIEFPHAEPLAPGTPSWRKEQVDDMHSRLNQWAHMPKPA